MKFLPYFLLVFIAFAGVPKDKNSKKIPSYYLIETEFGTIKVMLYNETPLHKTNFEKLVSEKFYDSTLFHRVIQDFMIQGGDPQSKNAAPGLALGNGGPSYTVPGEFIDTLIHKRGAIAAARQGDQVNPQRRSSGSQFYLVQGKPISSEELNNIEQYINRGRKQQIMAYFYNSPKNAVYRDKMYQMRMAQKPDSAKYYSDIINKMVEDSAAKVVFKYSEKAKKEYLSKGGTPFLDGSYTVFGEIVEGFNVLDSIAKVQKDGNDRPLKDIRMTIKKL